MYKMQPLFVTVLVLGFSQSQAFAQTDDAVQTYGSLGFAEDFRKGADLGAAEIKFGAKFNPYLGTEAELDVGTNSDVATRLSNPLSERINYAVAAYGVAYLPVTQRFNLLARLGVGETRFNLNDNGVAGRSDLASLNYGVGAMYDLNARNAIRVDYTRKSYDHNGGDDNVVAASLVHRF
jgi:hypothetical protein